MKTLIGFALFFCALFVTGLAVSGVAEEEASIFEGVMLRDLEGVDVAIDSLLAKGPLVVNFWATWCTPCRLEMPHLEKIYREFAPQGVQFAAVSVDRKAHIDRVKSFLDKQKMSVPAYLDHDTKLAKGFNVRAIPTTIIVLQDRSLYHRNKGYRSGDEVILRKQIQSLVETADSTAAGAATEAVD
jgi:thiol-disulfide isomerase/thioredoxin